MEEKSDRFEVFFAVTLETALLHLQILEGCCNIRCHLQNPLDGSGSHFNSQALKLIKERTELINILQKTLLDIIIDGKWKRLTNAVNHLQTKLSIECCLQNNHRELKTIRENIFAEIHKSVELHDTLLRMGDKKIAVLKDLLEDNIVNTESVLIYSQKWLDARGEGFHIKAANFRGPLPNLQHEQRVHEELNKAFEFQIKELENKISYWKLRYAEDTSDIKRRVAETRERLKLTTNQREKLQQLYDLHAGEMRAWVTFKTEKAARLAREKRTRDSAIKIQAWWRGLMVRKGFGAFRYLRNVKKPPTKSKKK